MIAAGIVDKAKELGLGDLAEKQKTVAQVRLGKPRCWALVTLLMSNAACLHFAVRFLHDPSCCIVRSMALD
jgi:hypothetical protein